MFRQRSIALSSANFSTIRVEIWRHAYEEELSHRGPLASSRLVEF